MELISHNSEIIQLVNIIIIMDKVTIKVIIAYKATADYSMDCFKGYYY
jgi:hypothetical protein